MNNVIQTMSPQPATGGALTDYASNAERAAKAVGFMLDVYVPSGGQERLIQNVLAFTSGCTGIRGIPLPGRALAAPSQVGKSSMIREVTRRANATFPANPHRVLHIELKESITLKMLYQRILAKIGDPEALGNYSLEILRQRCTELLPARGTHLLAIDEVQLLAKQTKTNYEVADGLKDLLDLGIVPVLFAGTEKALGIFEVNEQLRGRLGVPLKLDPVDPKNSADRKGLKDFAMGLDQAIADAGLIGSSNLHETGLLRRLGRASGGHIGRFSRIVGAALEHACARGASVMEPYDFSFAVCHLAVPARWTERNPFPEPASW